MKLYEKDIFIVLGPSRTGKGTLLCALQGHNIQMFKTKDAKVRNTVLGKEAKVVKFMACADGQGNPIVNDIMSNSHNSHTIYPKIVGDLDRYPEVYKKAGLENKFLIDFPGMFESKGPELDIAFYLTL